MAHRPIAIGGDSADGSVPYVLAALNLACQTATAVMEPASITCSFLLLLLLGRAPATTMRFATV